MLPFQTLFSNTTYPTPTLGDPGANGLDGEDGAQGPAGEPGDKGVVGDEVSYCSKNFQQFCK